MAAYDIIQNTTYFKFPISNNKELTYPINPEKEGLFLTKYNSSWFELRCYNSQNNQVYSSNWGDSNDSTSDTIWIGKDVDFVEFARYNGDSQLQVKHQITSLAFEDGRTDFQNIFDCRYEISGNNHSILDGSEVEFTDLEYFPFRINTSVKIPEGVSEFPGITLEAPFDLPVSHDNWTCRVVLPKTVESFAVYGSNSSSTLANDKNLIWINPSSNSEEYFSLNSEKGTVEIYLLDHEELPEINIDGDIDCNLKFILNDSTFKRLLENWETTEEGANEQGYYSLKIYEKSGLETKIAETVDTLKPTSVGLSEISDIFNAPLLEILNIEGETGLGQEGQPNYMSRIEGSAKIINLQTDEVKYLFFNYQSGSIEATLVVDPNDPNTQEEDVSSEVTIDPLYEIYGQPYYPTISFRDASGTSICNVRYTK